MKIICVGRNYARHARELGNEVPEQPVIFMKPATAMLTPGHDFRWPSWSQEVHYEGELVFHIHQGGKNLEVAQADACWDQVTLGIDFTARDLQHRLKEQRLPWELAKSFDGSAALGEWLPRNALPPVGEWVFYLERNGKGVQQGYTRDMLFTPAALLAFCSRYFTLEPGDLLFTGTPEGVGPIAEGDLFSGRLAGEEVLALKVRSA